MAEIRTRVIGRSRRLRANNTAPSSQTKEIVKSSDVSLQTRNELSKYVKKAKKAARASVDDACVFSAESNGVGTDSYEVYVDDGALNHDASFNLGNSDGNNNKFYYVQLLCRADTNRLKFAVWTRWGLVREPGQNKLGINMSLEAALVLFKSKFKDKTGLRWENRGDVPKAKEFTMIEKSYGNERDHELERQAEGTKGSTQKVAPPDCTLSEELQELIRSLFDTGHVKKSMTSQKYDFNKLRLGKLSKSTVEKGYLALKELADVILNPKLVQGKYEQSLTAVFSGLRSQYYSIIPHEFGRNRLTPITSEARLKAEIGLGGDLLETCRSAT